MTHPLTATAVIAFPKLADYLDPILASIATHDMSVDGKDGQYRVQAPFGSATLQALPQALHITVQAHDGASLNRMKHALAGPIGFIAAREQPIIEWSGDSGGLSPLDDLRVLTVHRADTLTPCMRRIVFHGDALSYLNRDDQLHCRLIFAPEGQHDPVWPMLDDNGRIVWPGGKMPTRVYTVRHINATLGELTIDFALHDTAGPATQWALAASPGDRVGIVGPAAGGLKPAAFYVLAGDESGLPGIARMLAALPDHAQGHAFIEVRDQQEEQPLCHPHGVQLHWLHRLGAAAGSTTLLPDAVAGVAWPADLNEVFVWAGCEYQAFRRLHRYLKQELGLDRSRQTLYSHWHRTLSEEQIIEIGGAAYLPE